MKMGAGKACQAEIISYLMAQVLTAPPVKREALFGAVKAALNVWVAGGKDMRSQAARNALEAGFGGRLKEYMAQLAHHSPRSNEWVRLFRTFKEAFEREAQVTLSEEVAC